MALEYITAEQLRANGMAAVPDVMNGTAAENKQRFDKLVVDIVAPAYNACVDAVKVLSEGEEAVKTAEAERAAAEQERVSAEAGREAAEQERNAAEQRRTDATDGVAVQAKSYAMGGTGWREGEDTDNARYYKEKAEEECAAFTKLVEESREQVDLWALGGYQCGTEDLVSGVSELPTGTLYFTIYKA